VHRNFAVTTSISTVPQPLVIPCEPKLCALVVPASPRCSLSLAWEFLTAPATSVNARVIVVTVSLFCHHSGSREAATQSSDHQVRAVNRAGLFGGTPRPRCGPKGALGADRAQCARRHECQFSMNRKGGRPSEMAGPAHLEG
jgi:hypothetical protein